MAGRVCIAAAAPAGGGGGRIAVWRRFDQSTGVTSNYVSGGDGEQTGADGTIVWGWVPPAGTVIKIY